MRAYELLEPKDLDGLVLNRERPQPQPGPQELLIRVHAASLNYRDLGVLRGAYGYTKFPLIPLSDGAGEVVAVGNAVTRFRSGDRVAGTFFQSWMAGRIPKDASSQSLGGMLDGMLAEYVTLPQDGAVALPAHLTFEQGATLPCAALTAWHALIEAGQIRAGETVLILGTGGVSCFGIQFARMHGARVICTSSSDAKLERARALGADELINYTATPDWAARAVEMTGGEGVDHVLEVGGPGTLERSIAAVRPGGTISVIGAVSGQGMINPRPINRKSITLRGIHVGSREMFLRMNRAISANALEPLIDRVFDFEDAKAAFQHQRSGAHVGKVVIRIS